MAETALASGARQLAREFLWPGALALVFMAGASVWATTPPVSQVATSSLDRVATNQPPKLIDDFELTDQDGEPFRFSQLEGAPALVFFGFTHCPDVCPSTLAKLEVLANSADQTIRHTALVMISVDGDRDNAAAMKTYLAQVSPRCIGLTGDPRTVRRIAAQFSGAFFKGIPDKPGGPYLVQHTSQIYLVDRQGRLRASFSDASIEVMRRTATAIADETQGEVTAAP